MQHFLEHRNAATYACGEPVGHTHPADMDSTKTRCRACVQKRSWRTEQKRRRHPLMGAEVIPDTWTVDPNTGQVSGETQLFFADGWVRLVRTDSFAAALELAPALWERHRKTAAAAARRNPAAWVAMAERNL